mmetsp:Transcript_6713/g.9678  ORF Transcript_6713/g.9678 Transcript_6713/m.9678 type:complete len:342 (-) Transcript_6713:257-1282(-)
MTTTTTVSTTFCINILNRLSFGGLEENVKALESLLPADDKNTARSLHEKFGTKLKLLTDPTCAKKFILHITNEEGSSYRSPWSNVYYSEFTLAVTENVGYMPSPSIREIECHANELFESYCHHYYGKKCVSSVYINDKEGEENGKEGFNAVFMLFKEVQNNSINCQGDTTSLSEGLWNSIHNFEVRQVQLDHGNKGKRTEFLYKLTSTVQLSMGLLPASIKGCELNNDDIPHIRGSLARCVERTHGLPDDSHVSALSHVAIMGKMIEELELDMRSNIDALYLQKAKEIICRVLLEKQVGKVLKHGIPNLNDPSGLMAALKKKQENLNSNALNAALLRRGKK